MTNGSDNLKMNFIDNYDFIFTQEQNKVIL